MRPDSIHARSLWAPSICLLILFLTGCASSGGKHALTKEGHYGNAATFPVPPEIRANVDFWRHVYGIWSRSEVAIHDNRYLGVIYEVARLPGPTLASYTKSQKAWLRARKKGYSSRLAALEQRVRARQPLSPGDKQLLAKLERGGGSAALYGASDRVRTQRGLRERFRRGVEISGRYDPIFRDIMRQHGVPEDLAYLPHVESSFQVNARSSAGASGVWQFMPATGRIYMTVNNKIDERYDPILAADGAARYLSSAYRKLGSWPLAITSYNHGQGGMAKAKSIYGNDIGRIVEHYQGRHFGFASRNFYAEFVAAREVARNAKRYFPEGLRFEQPWPHERLVLRHSMPASHLARHYGTSSTYLADLNLHWRRPVRTGKAYLPAGSTVWLPQGSMRRVASHPPPVAAPVMLARSEPTATRKPTSKRVIAKTDRKSLAKTKPRPEPRQVAKVRYHVVKPQETLYRVAVENGLSVAELRRLNKMRPDDNKIRPGQKLKLGI